MNGANEMTLEMPSRDGRTDGRTDGRVPYRERCRDEEDSSIGREGVWEGERVGHNSCTPFTCATAPQQRHYCGRAAPARARPSPSSLWGQRLERKKSKP